MLPQSLKSPMRVKKLTSAREKLGSFHLWAQLVHMSISNNNTHLYIQSIYSYILGVVMFIRWYTDLYDSFLLVYMYRVWMHKVGFKNVPLFETPVSLKFHMLLIHILEGCNVCSHDSRQTHRNTAVAVQRSDLPLVLFGELWSYMWLVGTESVGSWYPLTACGSACKWCDVQVTGCQMVPNIHRWQGQCDGQ